MYILNQVIRQLVPLEVMKLIYFDHLRRAAINIKYYSKLFCSYKVPMVSLQLCLIIIIISFSSLILMANIPARTASKQVKKSDSISLSLSPPPRLIYLPTTKTIICVYQTSHDRKRSPKISDPCYISRGA